MMKVLVVASGNANFISPFILDQVSALKKKGITIDFFLIKGKGVIGYIKNYKPLIKKINGFKPDIIHAHYGLSGLISSFQNRTKVVTTFHGSDINMKKTRFFSKISNILSSKSIFVSYDLAIKLDQKRPIVIPCGVDMDIFYPIDKNIARGKLKMSFEKKYVLFSSHFSDIVKNYPLAKKSISLISDVKIELIELKGYKREEVALLMNAVDTVLMTSLSEGSPQFIKEAMACNTPIISVDVGDVKDVVKDTKSCFITKRNPADIASKIREVLIFNGKTNGRSNIKQFDNRLIASSIIDIYHSVKNTKNGKTKSLPIESC